MNMVCSSNLYKSSRSKTKRVRAITGIIISCVVPPMLNILEQLSIKYFNIKPMIIGPGIKTGMPIFYDNPKEVGADRIVNAVAAYQKYKQESIIVDFGTATTFDYIEKRIWAAALLRNCNFERSPFSGQLNCRALNSTGRKQLLPRIPSPQCRQV